MVGIIIEEEAAVGIEQERLTAIRDEVEELRSAERAVRCQVGRHRQETHVFRVEQIEFAGGGNPETFLTVHAGRLYIGRDRVVTDLFVTVRPITAHMPRADTPDIIIRSDIDRVDKALFGIGIRDSQLKTILSLVENEDRRDEVDEQSSPAILNHPYGILVAPAYLHAMEVIAVRIITNTGRGAYP